ncbi:MAG: stage III sporulation protein AE, partial [Oscillospiraceae bacterium]|nr:stage III sporulation protein AE [Oscillospiraceae bacterium]
FSMVLLPCLSTAAAVSGAVTSAGVKYAASMLYFDGMLGVMSDCAVPLLYAYIAAMLSAQLTEHPILKATVSAAKQALRWALILIAVGFTLYLSLSGLLSGTVDAAAAKTAKTVLSSALPVVGGILSDASAALLSGAAMVRNGVGVFGLLAVTAACTVPFLTLGVHYLIFRAAAILAQSFFEKPISGLLNGFGDVYAFLLGMVGTATLMVYVSVISMMKAVGVG